MNPKRFLLKYLPPIHPSTKWLAGLFFTLLAAVPAQGQSKEELQKQRDAIIQKIELTNNLLEEKSKDKAKILGEISLLNKKIDLREDLIRSINRQINAISKDIEASRQSIAELEVELKKLRDNYAQMIRYAYRNRNDYNRLMYIFASEDFYQAFKRVRYLEQISTARKKQAEKIHKTQQSLTAQIMAFKAEIEAKEQLLENERESRQKLAADIGQRQSGIAELQKEEKKLKKNLREQEKDRERLNAEIQRIIEAEIKASRDTKTGTFALTPEAAALSASFESNKGKLPWPVERGVITGRYGQHPHPVLPGVETINNGINISTSENATVRAVFKGKVSAIFSIQGAGQNIIISHGAYRTVYSNLKEIFVSKGQEVDIKQPLGIVMTNASDGTTEAHIEIWKASSAGTTKQNPSEWLYTP